MESKTVIITKEQRDTVPIPKSGPSQLGCWMSEKDFEKAFEARFPGCMKGECGGAGLRPSIPKEAGSVPGGES